jgi:UDP-3-O-[3-hydroxymyristoyl] N-acetylglucosamine deacetylase
MTASSLLKQPVVISGPTLFTGGFSSIKISTHENSDGIIFKKQGLNQEQALKASLESVMKTPRTTILGNESFQVVLVEHLMAALFAFNIKNALIEIIGDEIPIGDGSAKHIVDEIKKIGFSFFSPRQFKPLIEPVYFEQGNQSHVALPSDRFKITYILSYENCPIMRSQNYSFTFDTDNFCNEIACCRTFAMRQEVDQMLSMGLLNPTNADCGIIVESDQVVAQGGLRFDNEMARHKILDFIGDFALADLSVSMHNISLRTGHQANIALAKKIKNTTHGEKA